MSKYECELATCPIEDCEAAKCSSRNDCSARAYAEGVKAGRAAATEGAVENFVIWNKRSKRVLGVAHAADTWAERLDADRLCERLNKEVPGNIYEVRSARLIVGDKA